MPNGIFPVPKFFTAGEEAARPPGLVLRLRTRLKRRLLDAELARGVHPGESDELTLRAAQLGSSRVRLELATELLGRLNQAKESQGLSLTLQSHRDEIRAAADDILALVLRLRDDRPIEAQGAALVSELLRAEKSPFAPYSGESIAEAVRDALRALDDPAPAVDRFRVAA